jgi:hypothetical protein
MRKNYFLQIRNGFRNRVTVLSMYPVFKLGVSFFIALAFFLLIGKIGVAAAGAKVAFAPMLKFNKDGLSGDNLKFMEDLEKRMKLEPDSQAKTEMMAAITDAKKEYEKLATRMKDLDDDKINLLKELLGTDEKGVRTMLQKQGETLTKLQAKIEQGPEDLSIRSQVAKWRDANKDAIAKLKNGIKTELPALEIRLNSPMTPSNTLNGSSYLPRPEFEAGATEIIRPKLTFWDFITKGRASSAVYVWVNKVNPEGAAAWIGPGVAKPGISLELTTEQSNAKKVAASEKVALELLEDVEGFSSYIEQELKFQVDKATNTVLMTGVASATSPAGIQTLSVPYSLAGVATDNPNNWDALVAVEAQLEAGNLDGMITHFVNPVDYANMILTKASAQGQLFVPRMPKGAIVVDNNIAVGFFQSGILAYYNVKIYKDYTVTYGWENDDFTKNLVTLVGERRIHQYFKEPHTGAFVYDSFADVKAAISAEIPVP